MRIPRVFRIGIYLLFGLFGVFMVLNAGIVWSTSDTIFTRTGDAPTKQTALILGARVYDNKRVSALLADRLNVGLALYREEKVRKIIVSGDHGRVEYDEVHAMRAYLTNQGVPLQDIFMDHAGFDTYDSVYRARDVFEVDSLIIVTQKFHLPRALFIAWWLGIDAVGVSADLRTYPRATVLRNALREPFARVKALINVSLNSPPKYLGKKISVTGDGRETDD